MAKIGEGGDSFTKSEISLPSGGNAYLYTASAGDYTIRSEDGEVLCEISGATGSGCKIWFPASEWEDGEHSLTLEGQGGVASSTLTVNISSPDDEGSGAGMIQMISAVGAILCLLSFMWLRSRRSQRGE